MNVRGESPLSAVPIPIASGKRGFMVFNRGLFVEIMRELNNVPGILGVMMVSAEREIIGSRLTGQLQQEKLVATGTDMMDMLAKVVSEYRFSGPKTLLIEGEEGRIAVVNAGPNIGYLVIAGTPDLNVGLAGIVLQDMVESFGEEYLCPYADNRKLLQNVQNTSGSTTRNRGRIGKGGNSGE